MNKRNSFFVYTTLLLLFLIVLIFAWGVLQQVRLNASSRELALNTTEPIFTNASAGPLIDSAHSSLIQRTPGASLERYITSVISLLGPLDSIDRISGSTDIALFPFNRRATVANYEIDLVFAGNQAAAIIEMVFERGNWQFTAYNVVADLLMN